MNVAVHIHVLCYYGLYCLQDVSNIGSNVPITSVSPAAVSIPVRTINAIIRDPHRLDSRQSQPSLVFVVWVVLN